MSYAPDVILMENIFVGYYGYYYPKDILWDGKDFTKTFWGLSKKHIDLPFYDRRIFSENETFKGMLFLEGVVGGKNPMLDVIEIHDHHSFRKIKMEGYDSKRISC